MTGCATRLHMPAATLPPNLGPVPRPNPGNGILVVDVVDGPTEVALFKVDTIRCTTPCWLELSPGEHMLEFKREDPRFGTQYDNTIATVTPETQVLRRALGRHEVLKPTRLKVAQAIFFASYVFMAAGALATLFPDRQGHRDPIARGLGLGGLSAWVLSLPLTVGTVRRYRGAQRQFPLPATQVGDARGR
jgi:hypothetical protein